MLKRLLLLFSIILVGLPFVTALNYTVTGGTYGPGVQIITINSSFPGWGTNLANCTDFRFYSSTAEIKQYRYYCDNSTSKAIFYLNFTGTSNNFSVNVGVNTTADVSNGSMVFAGFQNFDNEVNGATCSGYTNSAPTANGTTYFTNTVGVAGKSCRVVAQDAGKNYMTIGASSVTAEVNALFIANNLRTYIAICSASNNCGSVEIMSNPVNGTMSAVNSSTPTYVSLGVVTKLSAWYKLRYQKTTATTYNISILNATTLEVIKESTTFTIRSTLGGIPTIDFYSAGAGNMYWDDVMFYPSAIQPTNFSYTLVSSTAEPLVVNITSPQVGTYTSAPPISLNWSIFNGTAPYTSNVTVLNSTSAIVASFMGVATGYSFSFAENGVYYWNITVNDTNTNVSSAKSNFTINQASNSCTYSGSGNWTIQCSDYCNITTNTNLLNNTLIVNGSGRVYVYANLTNSSKRINQNNCTMYRFNSSKLLRGT